MSTHTLKHGFTAQQIIDEGRITQQEIDLLKTWLSTTALPNLTDEQIVLFHLSCENEEEATKKTIKTSYSARNATPELFNNRTIERQDLQKQLMTARICALPKLTDDGDLIGLYRLVDPSYRNFDFGPILTLLFMSLDGALYWRPPKGLIIIIDLQGLLSLMHLIRLRPGLIAIFFHYVQEGLPVNLKAIHVLNSPYFVSQIIALIKPFVKKEVLDAIYFHPSTMDMDWFYENCVPKQCLPEDMGGDLPCIENLHQDNIKNLTDLQPYFDAEEAQRRGVNLE